MKIQDARMGDLVEDIQSKLLGFIVGISENMKGEPVLVVQWQFEETSKIHPENVRKIVPGY